MTLLRPRAETRLHLLFRLGFDSSKTVNQGLVIDTAVPALLHIKIRFDGPCAIMEKGGLMCVSLEYSSLIYLLVHDFDNNRSCRVCVSKEH
jgi:hypothetical protein